MVTELNINLGALPDLTSYDIDRNQVRITFGLIVLNGMPFIKYNLKALYPYAHQIIVVEGAAPSAKYVAFEDGHSQDNTLDILRRFRAEEDPENKVTVITAEDEGYPNGFWQEKDEMSQLMPKEQPATIYGRLILTNFIWSTIWTELQKCYRMILK